MLRKIFAGSSNLIYIPIIGTFLTSLTILIYTLFAVLNIILEAFTHVAFTSQEGKHLAIECIQMIDLFLLGAVLYIISLGLYELFFFDEALPTPRWLAISNLEDLETILINVIIVLLAVTFLGSVVSWDGSQSILWLGIAVSLVLLALGVHIWLAFSHRIPAAGQDERKEE
jgi:uncharacterized membrane protein YqhA